VPSISAPALTPKLLVPFDAKWNASRLWSAGKMARTPCTHNRADVRAQIKLLESMGKTVTAVKYHRDGTFRLMTAEHKSAG
jgi:hypothetical protein